MALAKERNYTEEDYYNTPENVHVELIDGRIYNQADPSRIHQEILNAVNNTIYNYIKARKGSCKVYPAPFAVKLRGDKRNIVEPDISVICDPGKLTAAGCTGAPDWIVEIVSPGNSGHDYVRKLNLYLDAGVREYWIVNPEDCTVFVYRLEKAVFNNISYSFRDRIKAGIFEDLYIDLGEFWVPSDVKMRGAQEAS